MAYTEYPTVTISSGGSLSPEVGLGEKTLVGILMPAGWDAASITFQATPDDVNFGELYNSGGTEVTFTVAAGQFIAVDPTLWRGITGIKVRSGTSASPVNQTANRTLTLITRSVY